MARTKNLVQEDTFVHNSASIGGVSALISNLVYYLMGVAEALLSLRFIFRLAAANSAAPFVAFIDNATRPLLLPFTGIFPIATANLNYGRSVFEPATIVALVVYPLLAHAIVYLIGLGKPLGERGEVK